MISSDPCVQLRLKSLKGLLLKLSGYVQVTLLSTVEVYNLGYRAEGTDGQKKPIWRGHYKKHF